MIEFNDLKGITPESNMLHDSSGGEMLAITVKQIPMDHIRPDPEQPRRVVEEDGPAWMGLLSSVAKHGVLQPILVRHDDGRRGHYILVCGERRWRAAHALGRSHITARIVRDEAMLAARGEIQLLENSLREGLAPLDELDACLNFLESGRRQLDLAELLGVTPGRVSQLLRLRRIKPEVRESLLRRNIRLSRRQLLRVAAHDDAPAQMQAIARFLGSAVGEAGRPGGEDSPAWPEGFARVSFEGPNYVFEMRPVAPEHNGGGKGEVQVNVRLFEVRGAAEVAQALRRAARRVYRGKAAAEGRR